MRTSGGGSSSGGEEDVWLHPLDSRRQEADAGGRRCVWRWLEVGYLILNLASFGLALWLIIGGIEMVGVVWWYVVATVTFEASCFISTLTGMLVIVTVLGENGLQHALSFISILNELLFGFGNIIATVWGAFVIYELAISYKEGVSAKDKPSFEEFLPLLVYVLFTFTISLTNTVRLIPWILGANSFLLHQLKRKIERTPIVEFYQQHNQTDEFYVQVMPAEEYANYVVAMDNPITRNNQQTRNNNQSSNKEETLRLLHPPPPIPAH